MKETRQDALQKKHQMLLVAANCKKIYEAFLLALKRSKA